MSINVEIIGVLASFLLGSVPFAIVIAKIAGVGDITKMGSGNPGATNMARVAGKKLGAITLLLDFAKGFAAAYFFGTYGGVAAILGHCFSPFLKFKGGKGVATSFGVFFAINPIIGAATAAIWLASFAIWRLSSISALIAFNLVPFVAYFYAYDLYHILTAIGIFIAWRHNSNIKKLLDGTEGK